MQETARSGTTQDENMISLPGGYKISRRDALKLLPAAGFLGAGYSLKQNWQVRCCSDLETVHSESSLPRALARQQVCRKPRD